MTRVGIGIDSHRFVEGRPLILGGVEVPHDLGLSDGSLTWPGFVSAAASRAGRRPLAGVGRLACTSTTS